MLNLSFQVHSINELTGAMLAVGLAAGNNWSKLWLESITKRVVMAFSNLYGSLEVNE
jgi:hypothetical protein